MTNRSYKVRERGDGRYPSKLDPWIIWPPLLQTIQQKTFDIRRRTSEIEDEILFRLCLSPFLWAQDQPKKSV